MVYCPGLISREDEYYTPKYLIIDNYIGNYVYVYNRKCLIVAWDEFAIGIKKIMSKYLLYN